MKNDDEKRGLSVTAGHKVEHLRGRSEKSIMRI